MTKCIMKQALESIEAHAAHTISLIESNEMNVMTLYFRIDSIQTAARNALNAAKMEEEDLLKAKQREIKELKSQPEEHESESRKNDTRQPIF